LDVAAVVMLMFYTRTTDLRSARRAAYPNFDLPVVLNISSATLALPD
jgi:hypothetical protein